MDHRTRALTDVTVLIATLTLAACGAGTVTVARATCASTFKAIRAGRTRIAAAIARAERQAGVGR